MWCSTKIGFYWLTCCINHASAILFSINQSEKSTAFSRLKTGSSFFSPGLPGLPASFF
jgi:hypothetical protein